MPAAFISNSTKASELLLKTISLDRQLQLAKREQIAHEHGEPAVSGQRDHLAGRDD
jgi:hypothetical protein